MSSRARAPRVEQLTARLPAHAPDPPLRGGDRPAAATRASSTAPRISASARRRCPSASAAELTADDYLTTTYRGHGWALAKGVDLTGFFAELFGRETGVCRGRGGSMHLCDMGVGLIGASGIVGGGLPIAVGSACAAQVRGTDQVAVASFGDARDEHRHVPRERQRRRGLAAPGRLRVREQPLRRVHAGARDVPARRTSPSAPPPTASRVASSTATTSRRCATSPPRRSRARAAAGARRSIEAKTYRHRGHSRNDPGTLPAGGGGRGVARCATRSCWRASASRSWPAGTTSPSASSLAAVDDEIARAVEAASDGRLPAIPATLGEHVYATALAGRRHAPARRARELRPSSAR